MNSSLLKSLRLSGLIAIFSSLALTSISHAILDTNTNGLSDIWEKQFNTNQLFTSTNLNHNFAADPDQDGWNNAQEALAGTNPFSANGPNGKTTLGINPTAQIATHELTWPVVPGKDYRIQASTNLLFWVNIGPIIHAEANATTHTIVLQATDPNEPNLTASPLRIFYRVKVTDRDEDLDSLSTYEEFLLGTNPNQQDSDSDTINDLSEILYGTNPLDSDTDEDGIPDSTDLTPRTNDATSDPDGANLSSVLNSHGSNGRLLARYDFESLPNGVQGGFNSQIPGQASASAQYISSDIFANPSGMPSHNCVFSIDNINQHLRMPTSIISGRTSYVWSYWLKLPKYAFSGTNSGIRTLLSCGNGLEASGVSTALPHLHWYVDLASQKIKIETYFLSANIGIPIAVGSGWDIPPSWNDGMWHHIILHKDGDKYKFYLDGVNQGQRSGNNLTAQISGVGKF